jgi:DmsE family decaheme c-type cytochrome
MQFQVGRFQGDCQVCHGDATAHMESADPAKVQNPAKLSAVEASETCLKCHQNQKHQMFWRGSQHDLAGNGCLSCHSVHHAKSEQSLLKASKQADICFTCHQNIRKAQLQRSTHLFRDEHLRTRIDCASCHNVHGTQTEKLIAANSINDKCYSCHAEKRGPFLWEHSPAKENCMVCHSPHGSNQPKLLTRRAPMLCQSCHIQGRHQTVAGRPNSLWNINRSCLNCHPQVHGSNHPSGVILQR